LEGYGKYVYNNGDVHSGTYVNGAVEGYGEYHCHDGTFYLGAMKKSMQNGIGSC